MGVPLGIDRIELFTTANDLELAQRYPAGLNLHLATAVGSADEQYWAVTPTEETLLRITGLHYHVIRTMPVQISYPKWNPPVPAS